MVAVNRITPRKAYSTVSTALSTRSLRSCATDQLTSAFLSDARKVENSTKSPKGSRSRRRAKPFNCGIPSNLLNIYSFTVSLLLLISSFMKLQNDADVYLLDISWLMPSVAYSLAISRHSYVLPAISFLTHILSLRLMKTRCTLPDLIAIGLWFILIFLKLRLPTKDVIVYQLGFSATLSIVAFAVTFFPRKRLHRKKPNSMIQSAFSVASTPVSQCSTLTARSTPRFYSGQQDMDYMEQDDDDLLPDERHSSPSRDITSLLGGLNIGKHSLENSEGFRHRGPFSSMAKPLLAPSRFGAATESFRPENTCYASSVVPSIMTSVSQAAAQASFTLVNVICFSLLSVSVFLNFVLIYYALYVKCV